MRFAATGDGKTRLAVYDHGYTMPGRGAYLCRSGAGAVTPSADCLASALRRGGIPRALRAAVKLDPKLVESVNR
jgi:hypothetical protein